MLPPSNSPSDASALRRRARLLSGIGRSTSAYSPGPSCDLRRDAILAAAEPRALRSDALLDDRPARQRARVRAVGFGRSHEAIVVLRRTSRRSRAGSGRDRRRGCARSRSRTRGRSRARASSRCRERPDGRAILVGAEQAAERRRDAADGGVHESERLPREALQILHALAAPAAARERDLRDRRRNRGAVRSAG